MIPIPPLFAFNVGVNVVGNIGISTDGTLGNTQVFGQVQGAVMAGIGGFFGAGASGTATSSGSPLTPGASISYGLYAEADAGMGEAIGANVAVDANSRDTSVSIAPPKIPIGGGLGLASDVGVFGGITTASPSFNQMCNALTTSITNLANTATNAVNNFLNGMVNYMNGSRAP